MAAHLRSNSNDPQPPLGGVALPYVYRITKYDPADHDTHGNHVGAMDTVSDHGPIEAAYLRAVTAFAEDSGVREVAIREPHISSPFVNFGLEPTVPGHGLAGLFPSDLAGFHDGALVPVSVGVELVRAMLRDNGAWCRLEVEGRFTIHVGWDQCVYIGSTEPCRDAVLRTRALGLFPERVPASPYDFASDEPGEQRPADDDFWARLRYMANWHPMIVEERYVANAARWHRLTGDNLAAVRARLAPRALVAVWPDLSTEVGTVLSSLPEGLIEVVWEDEGGQIASVVADESEFAKLAASIADARAVAVLPMNVDDRNPLLTAVLPDHDGVLRARWRTEPTADDQRWEFMKNLRPGQACAGIVTDIPPFGVTFVDIGGCTGQINIPQLSWRHVDHPEEVVTVGQEVTAVVLGVDLSRGRVALSLKELHKERLLQALQHIRPRIGTVVPGYVTKVSRVGVHVRIDESEDELEGLIPWSDRAEQDRDAVQVGDAITVKIVDTDLGECRVLLSHSRASAADPED